ncbi:MAG: extracellular solute-binding protein, partial [Oscillospiraceae bacterium]
ILYFTDANSDELVKNGSFVDVATIRSQFPDYVKHLYPHAFTKAPDKKEYAVPTRGFYEALFCNKDLFDKYGLALPTDWASLMTAVTTFKKNNIVPFAVSFSDVPHYMIEHLVLAAGGIEDHKAVPTKAGEIPASWIKGMEQLKVLYDAGAFPVDLNATTDPLTAEMFYSKKAAMKIDGSWFMGGITDKENVVTMAFPSITKKDSKDIVAGFTSGWYITKKAWDDESKRQACVDFVEMVSTPEFLGKITTVAPCELTPPEKMTLLDQTGWDTFVKAGDRVDLPIDSRISGEAWSAWLTAVGGMAEGTKEPKKVLENVIDIYTSVK